MTHVQVKTAPLTVPVAPGSSGWSAWFVVAPVAPRTWSIAEPGHAISYLIEGDDRAVLLDTGLGLADIGAVVAQLTDRAVLVVNTDAHPRHRGGNHRFTDVAAHPGSAATLAAPVPADHLRAYLTAARQLCTAYHRFAASDRRFFHLFTDANTPRPLPPDADAWAVPAGPPPRALAHGQRLDLGGRTLTVLHTPGHSPGALSLVDEVHGLLFTGGAVASGEVAAHLPGADLATYASTVRFLAEKIGPTVRDVLPGHGPRPRIGPEFLRHLADALDDVLSGWSIGEAGVDVLGQPVLRHEFTDVTVLRPVLVGPADGNADGNADDNADNADGGGGGGNPRTPRPDGLTAIDTDLATAFARYEDALLGGDLAVLRELFWDADEVARVDATRTLVGPERLARYRAATPGPGPRRLRDLHVVASPGDTVVTLSINEAFADATLSAQTQVWARTPAGWRIIAAHVAPVARTSLDD